MVEWRDALRLLRREPGFALLAGLTMALGTGAVTVLFALLYGVLLKPLPWPDSDRLVRVAESRQGYAPRVRGTLSNAAFNAWNSEASTIEGIGGWRVVPATFVAPNGEPLRLQTAAVTTSLFHVLRARPHLGRAFIEDDGRSGGSYPSKDLLVLSYGFWEQQFGGRSEVIGSAVTVSGRPHTIVGVMPRDFVFPDRATQAWTPWAVPSVLAEGGGRRMAIFSALARLRPGVAPAQASAEATARARSGPDPGLAAAAMFGSSAPPDITAIPAVDMMTAEVRPALLMMFAGVVLLLATATANVASLQLARAARRRREFAIRAAIGAPAARLTRQLAAESVLLGLIGGAAGLAFAATLIRVLPSWLPADFPRIDDVAVGGWTVLFSTAISLLTGVSCSLLPALHARRLDVLGSLSETGVASGGSLRTPTMRARTAIMTVQIAMSCVLLVGAALLARSFVALIHSDRGYDPRNLLTARLPVPADLPMGRRADLLDRITARMQSAPGVVAVGYGNALPLVTSGGFRAFKMRAPLNPSAEVEVNAMQRVVSPGYFRALGLRLVSGRALAEHDTMSSRQVIAVNRSFADLYLGAHPLGAMVPNLGMCRGDKDEWEVVGVVDDMRQGSVMDPPQPEIFLPYAQVGCPAAVAEPIIVVRTDGDPSAHAATLRSVLRQEEPTLAFDSLLTMDERVMRTLARPRLYAVVVATLATFALTIAAVGVFGVLSYSVAQRSREISVHVAVGARPINVIAMVVKQAAVIAAVGIGAGLAVAVASTRWLTTVMTGIAPHDVVSFVAVPSLLIVVICAATIVPALRALRLDPIRALRAAD